MCQLVKAVTKKGVDQVTRTSQKFQFEILKPKPLKILMSKSSRFKCVDVSNKGHLEMASQVWLLCC